MSDARRLHGASLAAALRDSRARTLSLVDDLAPAQWQVPQRAGLNPLAWELAHLAWFAEFWVMRGPHRVGDDGFVHAARPPRHAGPDAQFDSARCAHAQRWSLPLPEAGSLRERLDAQLADTLGALARLGDSDDDEALYPHRLALFHEDMHAEALCWLRAALRHPAPAGALLPELAARPTTIACAACETTIGVAAGERGFAFDNERPGRRLALGAFEIDAQPVRNAEFVRFVEAGGYERPEHWPGTAGQWRAEARRAHPERWRLAPTGWQQRWFDRWRPLAPHEPVVHVNAWEAEAYCRWAGRRLPSAAEWEHAAPQLQWGHSVWEWTADAFAPYPGFEPGPYKDYSAPWFGDHRELRGGAFATAERLHDRRWRNFFLPARTDVFAGFRSARSL